MTRAKHIDAEFFREAIDYNPETGTMVWKARPIHHFRTAGSCAVFNRKRVGTKVGNVFLRHAYSTPGIRITMSGRGMFSAHRVAYAIYHGSIPQDMDVDHINGNGLDNRISNLRLVTIPQNMANRGDNRNNTSGVKGVVLRRGHFIARIGVGGKLINLGEYRTMQEAIDARRAGEAAHFGQYARANA